MQQLRASFPIKTPQIASMNCKATFLTLFAALAVGQAILLPFHDCDRVNTAAAFKNIVLLNCYEEPCVFAPDKHLSFEIMMMLNQTVSNFYIDMQAFFFDKVGNKVRVDTETLQPPNCKKDKCKIRAGDTRCIHPKLTTKDHISSLFDIRTVLYDQSHNRISCAAFTLRVAAW